METPVHQLNPLHDPRWERFLEGHPEASVFHTAGWLEALRRTYGYEPVAYTTTPPGQDLTNGLVFCRVQSWLTGRRLVSLPFSDHCQPLVDSSKNLLELLAALEESLQRERWRYIELRPMALDESVLEANSKFTKSQSYYLHILDLRDDLDTIYRGFHKKSVHHKLNRAKREGLAYEEGHSEALISKFFRLLVLTRQRHQIPPQPLAWFRNLAECFGERLKIRVVSKDGQPIASILTLLYKNCLVSKYGCSDVKFHHLGGIPLLLWKAIQDGKQQGAVAYDLGRSDPEHAGLLTFKENWGAVCSQLDYYRYPQHLPSQSNADWQTRIIKHVFSRMPNWLLTTTGKLLYRHIG
jgi:CelD/BcsL family acetyltransferase involved in cellulose biosynthesis